jgi:hypothetical protein
MVEGIERAFTLAEGETPRFGRVIHRLKGLAAKQVESAHDPNLLAQIVESALTARRPKPVYSVRADRLRSLLERLPLRTVDQVYVTLLRRANKE